MGVWHDRSNGDGIEAATESERERIREEFEEIVVSVGGTPGSRRRLHLPESAEGTEPLGDGNGHKGIDKMRRCPIEAFPPGFAKWCKYCIEAWRQDNE